MRGILAIGLIALAGPAMAKSNYDKLSTLTVDQFARKMEFRDDDLQTFALFSTQSGYRKTQSTGGLLGADSDVWLKASIDKKTGETTFAVMATISGVGEVQSFVSATYATPEGPHDARVMPNITDIGLCVALGCSHTNTFGVIIDEKTVQAAADGRSPWRFRFVGSRGFEFENAIAPVEAQALLKAVAKYRSDHPLRQSQ